MSYLIDTNVLIDFFHGKKSTIDKMKSVARDSLAVSIITQAELYHGSYKTAVPQRHIDDFHQFLDMLSVQTILLDETIVHRYGMLMAELEKKGQKLSALDIFIAATALAYNLTLLTSDKGFTRIQTLKVETV